MYFYEHVASVWVQILQDPKIGVGSSGIRVTGNCELPDAGTGNGLNSHPLKEAQVFLIAELSLQPSSSNCYILTLYPLPLNNPLNTFINFTRFWSNLSFSVSMIMLAMNRDNLIPSFHIWCSLFILSNGPSWNSQSMQHESGNLAMFHITDGTYGSGICCLLYVEVYFFYTQQIEFLTWKDVTFCQRLFLSILNKHLIMLIECITCWKSLHQSQIAWQKVFPMFYQAQFPHTFSIFCYIYFGREACMCRGVPVEVRGQIEGVGSFLQLHGFWRSNSVIRQGNDTLPAEPSHWPSVHIFG